MQFRTRPKRHSRWRSHALKGRKIQRGGQVRPLDFNGKKTLRKSPNGLPDRAAQLRAVYNVYYTFNMPTEISEDDFNALRRIDAIVEVLADASSRLAMPEPDSELHTDDQAAAIPGHIVSGIAYSAMSTALSGLQGFQALCLGVEKLQRSTTFGYVHRAALLGACEAYWVLRPDDRTERVMRAKHATLRRLNDEIKSKIDIQSMTRLFQDDRMVTNEELAELRNLRAECSRHVGGSPASLTRMFEEVASDLENDGYLINGDAEHFSQVIRAQWRISSADTHSASWQHRFNDPFAPEDDQNTLVLQRVADVGLIFAKALTAAEIADFACHFWEHRSKP